MQVRVLYAYQLTKPRSWLTWFFRLSHITVLPIDLVWVTMRLDLDELVSKTL